MTKKITQKHLRTELQKEIGIYIPENCTIIKKYKNFTEIKRADGLHIFLNKNDNRIINHIRMNEKNKQKTILAIGLYRGLQIANDYQKEHTENDIDYTDFIKNINQSCKLLN